MRIAFLGTRGIPAAYGGFESCVQELSTRLSKRGHDVDVFCRSDWPDASPHAYEGVHLTQVPRLRRGFLESPFNSFVTMVVAACGKADIVHFFGCGSVPFVPLVRVCGKKVVLTVDGIEWERSSYSRAARMYLRSFAELAMVFPHRTVADSKSSVEWYSRRTGKAPDFIPYGTKLSSTVDDGILEKFGLEREKYVFFAGRLVHEKGVHTLVDAFREVRGDVLLVVVGGFPGKSEYVESLRRAADRRVRFLGYVYGKDYETLRNASLVHVHPSLLEGTSISLLEAMGAGRCIISSDLQENVEVAGDSAIYFRAGDSLDLRSRLNELIEDKARISACRSRTSDRASRMYDWDDIADRYERIYTDLLGR